MAENVLHPEPANILHYPSRVDMADNALIQYIKENSPYKAIQNSDIFFNYRSLTSYLGDSRFSNLRVDNLSIAPIDVNPVLEESNVGKWKNLEDITGWQVNKSYTFQGKKFDSESFIILQALLNLNKAGRPKYSGEFETMAITSPEQLNMLKDFYSNCRENEAELIAHSIHSGQPIPNNSKILSRTLFGFGGQMLMHDAIAKGISLKPLSHKRFYTPDILNTEIPGDMLPKIPGQKGKRFTAELFTIKDPIVQGVVVQEEGMPIPSYGFLMNTEIVNRGSSIADFQKGLTMGVVPADDDSGKHEIQYNYGIINEPFLRASLRDYLVTGTLISVAMQRTAILNPFEAQLPSLGKKS